MACSGRTKRTADEHHAMSITPKTQSALEGLGMSLRDWFAGQASETDIAMHRGSWVAEEKPPYTREEAKYRYADAMLAARTKGARK